MRNILAFCIMMIVFNIIMSFLIAISSETLDVLSIQTHSIFGQIPVLLLLNIPAVIWSLICAFVIKVGNIYKEKEDQI